MHWTSTVTAMKKFGILFVLAGVLIFIAFQARTGVFRLKNPGEPANKYVRAQQEAERLAGDEAAIIQSRFADATVTPSGLRYIVRRAGEGSPPSQGAPVAAHYHGTFLDGRKFDSSYDRNEPFVFRVGRGEVIRGWDEAFATMKPGERRTLIVPWWLAYGENGRGSIPPRTSLVFEVELIEIR